MACQLTNNSNLDISDFEDTIQSLVSFSQDRFGFEKPPSLFLNSDTSNAADPLGKTAYYDPESQEIHIYVDERHPKDIMRSISHELIHHVQNLRGDLSGNHYHGEGYAQKDEHMREMEREAYEKGNLCFRDFEDKLKLDKTTYNEWRTNKMSLKEWKNNELFTLLSSKWGFGKNVVTEGKEITHMCALKVTHKESGQVGHPIKHTLTESGDISHYTVEFNKVIVENIAVENLDIMVQEEHTHKRDDEKPHSEEKPVVNEEELETADPLDLIVKQIRWYVEYDIEALKDFLSRSCTDLSEDNFNGLSERINQLSEEVSEQQFASINEIMTELKEGKSESVISEFDTDQSRLPQSAEEAAAQGYMYKKPETALDRAIRLGKRISPSQGDEGNYIIDLETYIKDNDPKNLTLSDNQIINGFVDENGGDIIKEEDTLVVDSEKNVPPDEMDELDESVERDLMQAIRALAADRSGTPEEDLRAAIKIMVDREIRRSKPEFKEKMKQYKAGQAAKAAEYAKGPQLEEETELEEDTLKEAIRKRFTRLLK